MQAGLVSIGMPILDAESTLASAVRSILAQTYPSWELLLIDDGSVDGTVELARSFEDERIKVIVDGRHEGLAVRLNEAIALGSGEYFARMDADDVAFPRRFEMQLQALQGGEAPDLVGTWVAVFRDDGVLVGKRTAPTSHDDLLSLIGSIPIPHPTFLGRMEWFRRHGYLPEASGFEDQLLLLTSFRSSRFAVVPKILLGYREDRLTMSKQFRYRSSYFRSRRTLIGSLGLGRTLVILAAQAGKLVLDAVAIGTGLRYRLLRRRARDIAVEESNEWAEVWRRIHQPVA